MKEVLESDGKDKEREGGGGAVAAPGDWAYNPWKLVEYPARCCGISGQKC